MSTDLYGVRILDVAPDERRMRMRVFVVYYDTHYESHQPIPSDRSFFVRVLCDRDALGDDIAQSNRFDEQYIDRNAFRFVERFEELRRRNHPVESYDDYADFYYERDGGWENEERLVQAVFDVWVTKPEYLEAFAEGDSWGTTSYPTNADRLTADEYPEIPDFGDTTMFTPFPEAELEASTVRRMSFSADGSQLLVSHDESGFRVFASEDWSVVTEIDAGGWTFDPGWTHDGRVAGAVDDGFVAWDPETGDDEPFEPFGWSSSSSGTRFVNSFESESAQILNEAGEVLFEMDRPHGHMAYAGFDASGNICALAVEGDPLRRIDLRTGDVTELGHEGLNSVALSPDGRYILASDYHTIFVLRAETGEAIRTLPMRGRYPTAVAWSPDGKTVATSITDAKGYHSRISLHRIGREVIAAENAPLEPPPRTARDIGDLASLFVKQTADFSGGWNSHLDDNLLDFHLTLARFGHLLDLVGAMNAEPTRIAARAYETVIAHRRDDEERAAAAFDDASARAQAHDVQEWAHTFVYAPLAAAQFVMGQADAAEESLALARVKLDEEANPFQKRAVYARALLTMGRTDEVQEIIDAGVGRIGQFHERLFADLADAAEYELLASAFASWDAAEAWDVPGKVQKHLLDAGRFDRAVSLSWLDCDKGDVSVAITAWLEWLDEDPEAASERLDAMGSAEEPDLAVRAVLCHRQPALANRHPELREHHQTRADRLAALLRSPYENMAREAWQQVGDDEKVEALRRLYRLDALDAVPDPDDVEMSPDARIACLGALGRWEEVYAAIDGTKKTLRNPLFERVADVACFRGDVDILLDAIAALPCSDMNAPGLRAIQKAFRQLGSPHFRVFHP